MPWIVWSKFLSLVMCTGSSDVVTMVEGAFSRVGVGRTDTEREEEAAGVGSLSSGSFRDQTSLNQRTKEVMIQLLRWM